MAVSFSNPLKTGQSLLRQPRSQRPKLNKVSTAITSSILALSGVAVSGSTLAQSESAESSTTFEEIIVTATRRSESLQDVAIAVQAIGEKQLKDLRIDNFEDYVSLIPGVNATGQGPGKQEVFIRGISPGRTAVRIASLGSEPSVANYLDETPTSYAGRNIDLFATDLNRIEVLKGPQGTLFGASSQGGALRLITNKPNLDEYEAGVTVDISDTSGGEGSTTVEGFINIPIVEGQTALRVAAYNADQGGYIDNIAATRQLALTNPGLGGTVPNSRATANNAAFVEDDYNDAEYTGFRASLTHAFNDTWSATAQVISQTLDTEGIFEFEPEVSSDDDLNARTFNADFGEDEVDLFSLTVEGSVGDLDVVYSGSYTERLFQGQTDYTGYANNGPFIPYYICSYPGYANCGSPSLITDSFFETERTVHELRVASQYDGAFNFIAGLYIDDQDTIERTNFIYPSSVAVGFQPNFPIPTAFATNPNARAPGVTFFNDFLNTREEVSFFGEASYQVNDRFKVALGARRYSIDIGLTGQSSFGSRFPGPESAGGVNVDANLAGQTPAELSDTIFKFNASYDLTDNSLAYFTYSEGFRSGGFNRNGGGGSGAQRIPFFFESDNANNFELGYKATLADGTLRFNASAYYVDFTDLQQGVLDFSIDNVTFFDNVGNAEIKGFEIETDWLPTDNLRLFSSFSYIDSELTELPATVANISPVGSQLPFAPETQATFGARYDREFGSYSGFAQGVIKYTDDRFTSLVQVARFELDSYTAVDASIGVSTEKWTASLYVDNLTDELGQVDGGAPDLIFRVIPIRPRSIGVRFNYNF